MKTSRKTNKLNKHKSGFTLIEVIVSTLVFGILAASVGAFMAMNTKLRQENLTETAVQQYAIEALEMHKSYWNTKLNYENNDVAPFKHTLFQDYDSRKPRQVWRVDYWYDCYSYGVQHKRHYTKVNALRCSEASPDVRRVTIRFRGHDKKEILRMATEVGRSY